MRKIRILIARLLWWLAGKIYPRPQLAVDVIIASYTQHLRNHMSALSGMNSVSRGSHEEHNQAHKDELSAKTS